MQGKGKAYILVIVFQLCIVNIQPVNPFGGYQNQYFSVDFNPGACSAYQF